MWLIAWWHGIKTYIHIKDSHLPWASGHGSSVHSDSEWFPQVFPGPYNVWCWEAQNPHQPSQALNGKCIICSHKPLEVVLIKQLGCTPQPIYSSGQKHGLLEGQGKHHVLHTWDSAQILIQTSGPKEQTIYFLKILGNGEEVLESKKSKEFLFCNVSYKGGAFCTNPLTLLCILSILFTYLSIKSCLTV